MKHIVFCLLALVLSSASFETKAQGCTDPLACNFDPNAIIDDGSCIYVVDCAGICGGNYVLDFCGNCYDPNGVGGEETLSFDASGAIQYYTIPQGVSTVTIEAFGAQGGNLTGNGNHPGGLGARMRGDFLVNPGDVLSIIVGRQGDTDPSSSGGGGGSGVHLNGVPLIIAGGGAGVDFQNASYAGRHGTTALNGNNGNGGGGAGGAAGGNGGDYAYNPQHISRGGKGWNAGNNGTVGENGVAVLTTQSDGVFGLGGGGGSVGMGNCNCGGGGGGYSGGGSGSANQSGGGGGSYNAGANQSNTAGVRSGNGLVTITVTLPAIPECFAGCTDPNACNYDADAQLEDGSCVYPDGCIDVNACNYYPAANCDNGTCVYPGCNDAAACNYNADAGCDDGSCIYIIDCNGVCGGNYIEDFCGNCYDPNGVGGEETLSFDASGAIQYYTIPQGVSTVTIEAFGAQGGNLTGNGNHPGGLGARMRGDFMVNPGDVLSIIVGRQGDTDPSSSGGGGGSGVHLNGVPLIIAGGGAGVDFQNASYAGRHGTTALNGNNGNGGGGVGGAAGGNGGDYQYNPQHISRGGKGWNAGNNGTVGENGIAVLTTQSDGVFGLGGGGGSVGMGNCNCGGGGGGYSGGGSGSANQSGGGGGSYNVGANQSNTAGVRSGNGLVTITVTLPAIPECFAGCTDPNACNYDADAQLEDGSCVYPDGCIDVNACNYDPAANCDNGTCVYPGCNDVAACNYNADAGCDDGSCIYVIDCNGVCGGNYIEDFCGNCYDPNGVGGEETLSFDASGAIQYYTVPQGVTEITIEAFGAQGGNLTGNGNHPGGLGARMRGDFMVNPGDVLSIIVGRQGDTDPSSSGGGGGSGVHLNGIPLIIAGGGAGVDFQNASYAGRHGTTALNGNNGNGGGGVGGAAGGNGGDYQYNPQHISRGGKGWNAGNNGTVGENGIAVLTTQSDGVFGLGGGGGSVGMGNCNCGGGGGGYSGGGSGSANQSGGGGGSYNAGANQSNTGGVRSGNGLVTITVALPAAPECSPGCTNPLADNYDPNATFDDGSCVIQGCTNPLAVNYNPLATNDDGTCVIPGCTYAQAQNYNPAANTDDGSCLFANQAGCTDPNACNYEAQFVEDDGSCLYYCYGCTDANACNFDPDATFDDGSCDFSCLGCTYVGALNYDPLATQDDGTCVYDEDCMGDLNGDGAINTSDLLNLLAVFGTNCP